MLLYYLVVDVISAHSDGVHNKLPSQVITGSTDRDVVRIVLGTKVVAQLMSGHQIGLLEGAHNAHITNQKAQILV